MRVSAQAAKNRRPGGREEQEVGAAREPPIGDKHREVEGQQARYRDAASQSLSAPRQYHSHDHADGEKQHRDDIAGRARKWRIRLENLADRVRENNWDDDLTEVLVQYPPVEPTAYRLFLPVLLK